jgi:DNA-binding NtrC family response regulator
VSKRRGPILIVDSDAEPRRALVDLLSERHHFVEAVADVHSALEHVERTPPRLVLADLDLVWTDGFDFFKRARQLAPDCAYVALTRSAEVDAIVDAIRRGADHCLPRPVQPEALAVVVERALEKPELAHAAAEAEDRMLERLEGGNVEQIVGGHPAMQQLLERALQAAQSRATVLVYGETGTGKELIAAAIHQNSKRATGPFVRLNCSALAETVLESELFGHEKGAFTGATARRRGRFEQADRGTLFLDEVSEIPPATQIKLLRFLQEREFERMGGEQTIHVDVRIVAATNRDLKPLVDDRKFREDLYYRLNVVRLEVPPLRARPSDIPLLADFFLRRYAEENEQEVRAFTDEANQLLMLHPWPGNVRELQNVIEQAVVLCRSDTIDVADLPIAPRQPEEDPLRLMIPGVTLAEVERYAIVKTLEAVKWSPSKAAAILGISRRTVQYRMRQWGIAGSRGERSSSAPSVDAPLDSEHDEVPEDSPPPDPKRTSQTR